MESTSYHKELKAYIPKIFRAVRIWVSGSGLDPEDLTQDIMLKAIRSINSYKGDSQLYTWLYTIARNSSYDALRKLQTERKVLDRPSEAFDFDQFGEDVKELDKRENIRLFHQALSTLSDSEQDLIRMKDFEELSYQQMADVLGIPEGTAKSRLFKARLSLKKKLQELGYEHGN